MNFPDLPEDLLRRYDTAAPRYTSYPTAPTWTTAHGPAEHARALDEASRDPTAPLSLYVHLPFCWSLCTYCGCNVVITNDRSRADRYLEELDRELALVASHLGERRTLSQLHWGGGTPTFLDERQLRVLTGAIKQRFTPLPDAEVAIEIHPGVTTPGQLATLRELGFNRLSMGIQDFDPKVLSTVNRRQTFEETRDLLAYARKLEFSAVNFDLIYGLPFQTEETWAKTLDRVLELRPDRLAVYSLAYVPEIKRQQKILPKDRMAEGHAKLALFRRAFEALTGAGYRWIGFDHFARPDDELSRALDRRALDRTFQGYTVKAATDLVGIGASAISDVRGTYAQNHRGIPEWSRALAEERLPVDRGLRLSDDDLRRRAVVKQLTCNLAADVDETYFARELEALRPLEADGLVTVAGAHVEVTELGRLFARNVASVFDAYLARGTKPTFSRTV